LGEFQQEHTDGTFTLPLKSIFKPKPKEPMAQSVSKAFIGQEPLTVF
jgi:hypothetical protein